MIRFSEAFQLGLSQPELDFVDIYIDGDMPVFVDPFAISLYGDTISRECNNAILGFFHSVIVAIRTGNSGRAKLMLNNLSEPNETKLGVSSGESRGRGVSGKQAGDLYKSLAKSKAAISGLVNEISECDLFIEGIGRDKISDITTNIIRQHLIEYTQQQCDLHNIKSMMKVPSGRIWDSNIGVWREKYTMLPVVNGMKVILVPRNFVRRNLAINSQDYLNKHVLEYLQAEHLQAGTSLVEVLKNGVRRVTKKTLRERYPCTKDWMAQFTKEHPDVLEEYKEIMKKRRRFRTKKKAIV
jgi:hypothetical protein